MKLVEQCSISQQTPTGFNDGMNVVKPLWGLGTTLLCSPHSMRGYWNWSPLGFSNAGTTVIPNLL